MQNSPLTPGARKLVANLEAASRSLPSEGTKYHVASIGAGFYFAYEQLRNVAEYREHHLLLRSAIERFLVRNASLRSYSPIAADLVTELTQSGYLKNDSIPVSRVEGIDTLLGRYADIFHDLSQYRDPHTVAKWIMQYASVKIEQVLTPDAKTPVFMQFAYEHYLASIDSKSAENIDPTDQTYRIALFCAVQRSIFKSNLATVRFHCFEASLGTLDKQPADHIVQINELVDELYQAPITNRLTRLVTRYGAPMRIMRELVMDGDGVSHIADRRSETISKVKSLCVQKYQEIQDKLSGRIGKTILFILITKTVVGVSIEVPYDLAVHGSIAWLPLLLNISFPVLYMATIGARIKMPSRQNTEVVSSYIDRILYDSDNPVVYKRRRRVKSGSLNVVFSVVYAIGFIGSIGLLLWILHKLHFNLANGAIFFIFLSAVSFLGFRLRQTPQEYEMLDERQGLLSTIIDFLSTPFVRVGHWISDKYSKANIVTIVLDMAIEMPLKTSLRFVQQWIGFLRDKQEEL